MKAYCLALNLIDHPALIAEYQDWHKAENGWRSNLNLQKNEPVD
jgi:hypothetical protein